MCQSVYKYNSVCFFCGHVQVIEPGSKLEEQAKVREKEGKIDAIILGPGECDMCNQDQERDNSLYDLFDMG